MQLKPRPGILSISPYQGGLSKAAGAEKVLKLSSNENPFGASKAAKEAYIKAAENLHRYPDGAALALREAIADCYKLPKEQIICGAGSDELISLLCKAYAGEGDEILYSQYGFLMYPIAAHSVGAQPIAAPEAFLRADIQALIAAITPKTRIVFLANPNNPTGSYITKAELDVLHAALPENVLLVVDAAYAEYVEEADYSSGEHLIAAYKNVVMTRTFSKIYGLAALRLGWAYAAPEITDVLNRLRGPFNVSSPAIYAGIAALGDEDFVARARVHNRVERLKMAKEMSEIGLEVLPSVANFLLLRFKGGAAQADSALAFLMGQGIILRAMKGYGLADCLRVTIGSIEENQVFCNALRVFLDGE